MTQKNKIKQLILIIMDGWGLRKSKKGNAIALAPTPNFNNFRRHYPFTQLRASGTAVGLMKGMIGNSETGHCNIGAGRVVPQDILRINKAIADGSFFRNPALLTAIRAVKKHHSALHLMGLLSDAGVHSYDQHLYALLKLAHLHKVKKVFIHVFTDGRDTNKVSARKYIRRLKKEIRKYQVGKIATMIGRYFSMDRDHRWKRTEKAYRLIAEAKGKRVSSVEEGLKLAYAQGETDEFISPLVIGDYQGMRDNDAVIFWNFRTDRPRQLVKAFTEPKFTPFQRKRLKLTFVCLTDYYKGMRAKVAFSKLKLKNVLGEVLSKHHLPQLRISESEKYAHVTYFFNGLREKPFPGEERIIIPSPKVATYDLSPQMSALPLTKLVVKAIRSRKYKVIIFNIVNADMVGHTGNLQAAIKAIATVDKCVGRITKAMHKAGGISVIIADHGNAEEMVDPRTGEHLTSHTTNPVPFILVNGKNYKLKKGGKLADVAPTILDLLDIKKPREMTGHSLIIHQ